MEFKRLLEIIGDDPVFESALLMAGNVTPNLVHLQLSRWTKSGHIYQLRRGLYAIAPPYQKIKPHPFVIANRLQQASYISLQSALAFYGLIPDTVHNTMSVTAGRPERVETPLGIFEFRHIQPDLFRGYRLTNLRDQQAMVATPEKALLDLVYLQPSGETLHYLRELRLQNLDRLNVNTLRLQSSVFNTPKLHKAVEVVAQLTQNEFMDYSNL